MEKGFSRCLIEDCRDNIFRTSPFVEQLGWVSLKEPCGMFWSELNSSPFKIFLQKQQNLSGSAEKYHHHLTNVGTAFPSENVQFVSIYHTCPNSQFPCLISVMSTFARPYYLIYWNLVTASHQTKHNEIMLFVKWSFIATAVFCVPYLENSMWVALLCYRIRILAHGLKTFRISYNFNFIQVFFVQFHSPL